MRTINNIFLVGPMGVGKTTIGRQLAKKLDKQFIDSDIEIENRTGVTISVIFEIEQEAGFRKRETAILHELTRKNNIVLATGGGAILSKANRSVLSAHGYVIYLQGNPDNLLHRTSKHRNRPLLDTKDSKTRLLEILKSRIPLYENIADVTVNTDNRPIRKVVNEIASKLLAIN